MSSPQQRRRTMKHQFLIRSIVTTVLALMGCWQTGMCQDQSGSAPRVTVEMKFRSMQIKEKNGDDSDLFFVGIIKPEIWAASTRGFHAGVFVLPSNAVKTPAASYWSEPVDPVDVLHVTLFAWKRNGSIPPISTIQAALQGLENDFTKTFAFDQYYVAPDNDSALKSKALACKKAADEFEQDLEVRLKQWAPSDLIASKKFDVPVATVVKDGSVNLTLNFNNQQGNAVMRLYRTGNRVKTRSLPPVHSTRQGDGK